MRRRITLAIVAVTALAVALFGVPLALIIRRLYVDEAQARLDRIVSLEARGVVDADPAPASLPDIDGVTLTLYGTDGRRLLGAGPVVDDRAAVPLSAVRHREHDDRLTVYVPLQAVSGRFPVGGVLVGDTSVHAAEHRAHLAWALMAALGAGVVLLAGALGTIEANRLVRPVRLVRDRARQLGQGDFTIEVPPSGVRELDDLGDALTTTAGRLGDALARERAFSAHASHQLRTPLTGLRVTLESELVAPRPDPTLVLHEGVALADRLERTIDDLLRLARRTPRGERLNIARLRDHLEAQWTPRLAETGRVLRVVDRTPVGTVVMATGAALEQAADVLVDNARRHGAGPVTVTIDADQLMLVVRVTDAGPAGTSAAGHGVGLGLAEALVAAEGGHLSRPDDEHPTSYSLVLPIATGGP